MLPPDHKKPPQARPGDAAPDHVALPPLAGQESALGPPPSAPPPGLAAAPGLGTMLHALRRSWAMYVPVALLLAAAGAGAALLLVPGQYVSTIVFRIVSRPAQGSLEDEGNFANVQRAQVAAMKGLDVLAEAIGESQVAEKYGAHVTPRELQKRLATNFNDGPELLQVQWSGSNAEAIADLLNALGEVYPRRVRVADEARVTTRIAQLRRRLQLDEGGRGSPRAPSLAEQLRDRRVELQKAEKEAGLDDARTLAEKHEAARRKRDLAERDWSRQHQALLALQDQVAAKQARQVKPAASWTLDPDIEAELRADPDSAKLSREIAAQGRKIEDLKRLYRREVWPEKLAKPEAELLALEGKRQKMVEKAGTKVIAQVTGRMEQARREEERLDLEVRRLSREVDRTQPGSQKVPPDVAAKRDQVDQLEREMRRVGDELAGLEGSLPLTPRVTVQAPAVAAGGKDYSRTLKFAIAGALGAFGLGLAGLCFLETLGRRVYASEDITQGLGLPVVGTLPGLPARARGKSGPARALGLDARYGLTEAVDALRTMLLYAPKADGARVVLITSAGGGEGKTTLASHLAASLARGWRKTLLIDGDLRNPAQHLQFDLPLEPGLAEGLRAEVELEDVVQPTRTSRLWLMTAGKADAHALQALAQDTVGEIFDRLKEQYDFIVLDTSPVLPVPDGLLLARHADVVLLSVMKDISRAPAVYQAHQRLECVGARVFGTVVIGEKAESYGRPLSYPQG